MVAVGTIWFSGGMTNPARAKASIMQRVVGDAAAANENRYAIPCPVEQRVHLDDLISKIEPDATCLCTLKGLVSVQSTTDLPL